jgi:hypothetical protein
MSTSDAREPRAGHAENDRDDDNSSEITLTRWQKIENIIWDGGHRTPQERRLVRRLDIFIMFVLPCIYSLALFSPSFFKTEIESGDMH